MEEIGLEIANWEQRNVVVEISESLWTIMISYNRRAFCSGAQQHSMTVMAYQIKNMEMHFPSL